MGKFELGKRLIQHFVLGAVTGYAVLHPASVVIHDISSKDMASYTASILTAFSREHFRMAFYFSIIGAVFGLMIGLNTHRQAILYSKIEQLSVTDELTGLYNRRFIMQSVVREMQRTERYGGDMSLLMIDIDHFKQFNDIHGHPAGDRLLKRFADRLRRIARKTDVIARYGGEEFLILLPNTDETVGVHLAERIRKDIETYPFELRETQPMGKITVSIGCAHFDTSRPADDMQDLIKAADDCLYRAKKEGRNQIAC